jgi:3-oxoacyl-[acyl-carrier protein] reductase
LTIFLTGCANGIGRHMARVFYEQGHNVVVTDIDAAGLETLAAGWERTRALVTPMDVRRPDDWQRVIAEALSRWGRIDVGLNIAGIVRPGYVMDFALTDIDLMVDVNLKGVMLGTRLLGEQMVRQGRGHLVNIASLAGTAPIQGLSVYSATKFAVRGFTLAAAGELRKHGVRVSCVSPDLVDTNMVTDQIEHPAAALSFSGGRLLTVQDIEQAILHDALHRNKLDILLPTSRGWLGKIGNLFPELGFALTDSLTKKGLKQQSALRDRRQSGD